MIKKFLYAKNAAIQSLKELITAVFAINAFRAWIITACGLINVLVLITERYSFCFYL
jgi:hypothetical protein